MKLFKIIDIVLVSTLISCVEKSSDGNQELVNVEDIAKTEELIKTYYPDSTLKEIARKVGGILEGKAFKFNEDGTKQLEYAYMGDKLHGIQREYMFGKLSAEENFKNGEKNGWSKYYNADCGYLLSEGNYENGKMIGLWFNYMGKELDKVSRYFDDELQEVVYQNKKFIQTDPSQPPITIDCD